MKKSITFVATLVLISLIGCDGGDSNNNGQKGPSNIGVRHELGALNESYHDRYRYEDSVQIESIWEIITEGIALDVVISKDGRVAYVASGEAGLEVIDISDPENPRLEYSYDLPEYVNHVELREGKLYVANMLQTQARYNKLYAFTMYNPHRPEYYGSSEVTHGVGHSRVKKGSYLYEVGQEGLQIHKDVHSTFYPVGRYDLDGTSYAVAVKGQYIFVANGRNGLRVLKANVGGRVGKVIS